MSNEEINQSIEALHTEISQLNTTDKAVKDRLLSLVTDLEDQIQNPDSPERRKTTAQGLPTLIEQFESDHPRVTDTLSRLLTTLSGMGI
ncbi:DUF4404 family protein [Leptolyngbya sp. BC1307]|uniref:DUF4404 family protein n=1 Tax=Leptolyngbya sp. BC1307 TaxID=2029589 RepID=UPI000EFC10D2|nr:DUF4404 family protein [Leptolyngbya sp. BC1307]